MTLDGCRTQSVSAPEVVKVASPSPAAHRHAFAIPVGLLPVNVVGSYGGGNAFAKRAGAGKNPLPSGIGIPVQGASPKQTAWACMVLIYGNGASVQYEGMGHCGMGKPPAGVKSAACEIPLPNKKSSQSGVLGLGWCAPVSAKKRKQRV